MNITKKIIRGCLTALAFVILFTLIQTVLVPQYGSDSTTKVEGYYALEKNSVDVLFVGPSQMFCTVDAPRLYNEHGIHAYDFGASDQRLSMSYYYLIEALKTQNPKAVFVEVCEIFEPNDTIDDSTVAWNYAPMRASTDKYRSLLATFQGDKKKAFEYSYVPLFAYHSRWNSLRLTDFVYYPWFFFVYDGADRGFTSEENSAPQEIVFDKTAASGEFLQIPAENQEALLSMNELCKEKGIEIVYFKAPSADWTKNESASAKAFMEGNGLTYLDMNDYLTEIGIDPNSDFRDENHLNSNGAAKSTDFLAQFIASNSYLG